MNRRGFFKSLALIGAAASVSPHIFIPKFEPVKWKVWTPPRRGFFIAEFKAAIAPLHTEFGEMIWHKREPVPAQAVPNPDWVAAPAIVSGWGDERFVETFKRDDKWKISFPLEPTGQAV